MPKTLHFIVRLTVPVERPEASVQAAVRNALSRYLGTAQDNPEVLSPCGELTINRDTLELTAQDEQTLRDLGCKL